MTHEKRKPGRPALPPGEKLVVVPVRLTEAQKAELQARGGASALREWLSSSSAYSRATMRPTRAARCGA